MPPSPEDQGEANADRDYRLEYKKYVVECFTLGGLLAYVVINFCILHSMNVANGLSRESLTTLQRAFIFDSGADLAEWYEPFLPPAPTGQTSGVIMHFQNSGASPATDVVETTNLCVLHEGKSIDTNFSFTDLPDAGEHRRAFVGPKSTFDSALGVRPELLDEVGSFKKQLFIWGRVRYLDIFRKPHITQFCEHYLGFTKTKNTGAVSDIFEQCPAHNCADNDCKKIWGYDDTITCDNVPPQPPSHALPAPK